MSEQAVIDSEALDRLREWGGSELIAKMIRIFLEHAPTRMDEIRAGVADGELPETEKGAHSLKSSAGNLGAVRLRDLCARLEDRAEQGDAGGVESLMSETEAAYREATEALTDLLEELDAAEA